jgi:hypothetical protein
MHYTIMAPGAEGYVLASMNHPTWLEALRLAWRLFRRPTQYGVMVQVEKAWVERYCGPAEAGTAFYAPLGKDRK